MTPISPELVLVDPGLRARISELPSGPVLPAPTFAVPAPAAADSGPNALFGRVVTGAVAFLVFLALPLLALASDLVRQEPRLAPSRPARSELVHVGAQQHVGADLLRRQSEQLRGGK
jgi:hypothetical protein